MIGTIFLKKEIVEVSIAEFPRMHQQTAHLIVRQVQPVFPDIAIFNVTVFLNLHIVRDRRKKTFVSSGKAFDGKHHAGIARHIGRVINGVGQNACLFRLALPIDPQERMAEHRRRVIHIG